MPVRARVRLRKKEVDALIETLDDRREMPIVAPIQTMPIAVADAAVAEADAPRPRIIEGESHALFFFSFGNNALDGGESLLTAARQSSWLTNDQDD